MVILLSWNYAQEAASTLTRMMKRLVAVINVMQPAYCHLVAQSVGSSASMTLPNIRYTIENSSDLYD
jgi:hypothetical protein